MKDLLRFDTIVAACALLVSVITATVLGYQTHVVEEQYAATIWPYLSVDTSQSTHELKISLTNNGLGPALIGSAQLFIDGHPAPGWVTLTDLLLRDPALASIPVEKRVNNQRTSLDGSTTIRPGDSLSLLRLKIPDTVPRTVLYKHHISIQVCYCSLNDRCWNINSLVGSRTGHPTRTSSCPLTSAIEA